MGLVSAVENALDDGGSAEETFAYRCGRCEERFELPKTRLWAVRCPECGSSNVRDAERTPRA